MIETIIVFILLLFNSICFAGNIYYAIKSSDEFTAATIMHIAAAVFVAVCSVILIDTYLSHQHTISVIEQMQFDN